MRIQTRLGDKVIIFQSANKEITMKTKHDIIQSLAKEKKQT